jgi:tRNA 2-thiouridine synthesizing protein E
MTKRTLQELASGAPRPLPMDADGFIVDAELWNPGMARAIARMDDVGPLTKDHWSIIYYLREHRMTYGAIPPVSQICRTHGMDKGAVRNLFGSCREAWRVAGLPHPGEEALSYMG